MPHRKRLCGKYVGSSRAQNPLLLTDEFMKNAGYHINHIDAELGYQAGRKKQAAGKWTGHISKGGYVWLGISGAATPAGLGGIIAGLIEKGLVDAVVSTVGQMYTTICTLHAASL